MVLAVLKSRYGRIQRRSLNNIVFSAITTTFLTVVDRSNTCSCTQITSRFGLITVVSYDFWFCNARPLSNSQGKVATLIR